MLKAVKQVLERWSLRAIGNRLDKRRLQHELDVHRLFLVTSHYEQRAQGDIGHGVAERLAAEADSLGFEGMQQRVAGVLRSQIVGLSSVLHAALSQADEDFAPATRQLLQEHAELDGGMPEVSVPVASERAQRPRGLAMAVGQEQPSARSSKLTQIQQSQHRAAQKAPLDAGMPAIAGSRICETPVSMQALSAIVKERLGYTLHVSPSAVAHQEAGQGLWLDGRARLGAVVALYPGVVYRPLHYRQIPGYPRVDQDNDYLLARFDGAVLDAKPWGFGAAEPAASLGRQRLDAQKPSSIAVQQLLMHEHRHPLALAHFANHPAAGTQPNTMVAAFDIVPAGLPPWLPAYIPNVMFSPSPASQTPSTSSRAPSASPSQAGLPLMNPRPDPRQPIPGLALVALRDLQDEELLLNYRLSPHVSRPAWYMPVDAEEDNRRWA